MHRVLFLFLFSFILGGKAARPAHKANETLGTCCCFRPGTGEKRVYTGTTCPKRPDGSKDQMPRGCAKKEGDTDAPCLIQKGSLSAPNGVPHPRDLYCENYLIFTCGEHEISIPDEWRNCYIGTSKLRNGGGPAVVKYHNPVTGWQILGLLLIFSALFYKSLRAMMDGPSKEEKKPILADPEPQVRAPHFQGDAMDKKAIIEDMIAEKIQKVEELTEKIQRHQYRQQLEQAAKAKLAKQKELEMAAVQQERAAARAESLAAFEARVSAAEKKRRAAEAEMVRKLREQDAEQQEKAKQAELERCRVRDRRLAQHRRQMAERFWRPAPAPVRQQPEVAKATQPRPRSAPAASAATVARRRGLHLFAESLDAAHSRYLLRPRTATGRTSRGKPAKSGDSPCKIRRPKSAAALCCVTCGRKVEM
ncbi:hypothetical protein AK812_SmicGene11673 [Symbiodinium microadriaticum]|uniref:Reticulocyte-binding protein 2-like a n=1 Tax=Symbiodinium microadriaticum TaxID=2951 RepID=A0A1Q9ECM8_SYMMI|nr:hypothetical protein AK812_SmicGene11673 [Symbiodinium microadriaticum]